MIGTILGGSLILAVLAYTLKLSVLLSMGAHGKLSSDSKGTKKLRFQEWNPTYQKYCTK